MKEHSDKHYPMEQPLEWDKKEYHHDPEEWTRPKIM
jgi:hypothetical protein